MRYQTASQFASSLLIFLAAAACGTKKSEERLPPVTAEENVTVIDPILIDSPKLTLEAPLCTSNIVVDDKNIDLSLSDLPFHAQEGTLNDRAGCSFELKLKYDSKQTFAIRAISVPVIADLKEGARALVQGKFGIETMNLWEKSLTREEHDDIPQLIGRSVADSNLEWAPCDGRATVRIDTQLTLLPTQTPAPEAMPEASVAKGESLGDYGHLGFVKDSAMRIELVWAPCPALAL